MKFILLCLIFSLALSMVACSSVPGNRSSARAEPSLSTQEQEILYERLKDECVALRSEFFVANSTMREIGKKWRRYDKIERFTQAGRRQFAWYLQITREPDHIQHDSKEKMKVNKQEIVTKVPSRDASVCDTENLDTIMFPPSSIDRL